MSNKLPDGVEIVGIGSGSHTVSKIFMLCTSWDFVEGAVQVATCTEFDSKIISQVGFIEINKVKSVLAEISTKWS